MSPSVALSIPVLSVDTDTTAAGIQLSRSIGLGEIFDVDIIISDVEFPDSIAGFQLRLGFDDTVLRAVAMDFGDFLLEPTLALPLPDESGVELARQTLQPIGSIGGGTLATVTFEAIGDGLSTVLSLDDVVLSAPFGVAVPYLLEPGRVAAQPIPEPGAAVLFGVGLCSIGLTRRVGREKRPPPSA